MLKSNFLASLKRKHEPFEVNGVTLHLKPWNTAKRIEFFEWKKANPGTPKGFYEKLFALSVCDADGNLLLDGTESDLSDLDGLALEKIAIRVIELNGLKESDSKATSPDGE